MAVEINVTALRRAIENWNQRNYDAYLELYSPSVQFHGVGSSVEEVGRFYQGFWSALPGCQLTLEDVIAEGDRVATRFVVRGSHQGELMGIPPTGKQVEVPGITILRFEGGKCVERWNQADFLGLLQQLGAIPPGT